MKMRSTISTVTTHGASSSHTPQLRARPVLADATELPLLHKRILVTAPRQYAHKLVSKLVEAGARALWVPAIAVTRLQHKSREETELHGALSLLLDSNRSNITHIAFTSRNGIAAFLENLGSVLQTSNGGSRSSSPGGTGNGGAAHHSAVAWLQGSGLRLCALGADAEALSSLGLAVHVVPAEASTQGLVRELVRLGEAAQGLVHLFGLRCICDAVQNYGTVLAAHGPYTAAGAASLLGLPVTCVSTAFSTFDGLVVALEAAPLPKLL
ncbi:MAG: hypothetical protein WDW38_009558 [Sanguina aurantia]